MCRAGTPDTPRVPAFPWCGEVRPLAVDGIAPSRLGRTHRCDSVFVDLNDVVVSQLVGRRRSDDPLDELTAREREVLELMAEGLSNSAIAARIFLTERGVEKHVTSIFQKLRLPVAPDTHRRVLAVVAFLQS